MKKLAAKKQRQKPYDHNVDGCLKKIIQSVKKEDPSITGIVFELSTIQRFGTQPERYATGQGFKIYRQTKTGKEVSKKSFYRHNFCPFCGKKF